MAVSQGNGLNRGVADATYTAADSDEIRRDIDQTRCEMDRTIDELGERLRPRNLFDEVVASVRGSLFSGTGASCPPGTTGGMTSAQMSQQVSHLASGVGRSLLDAVRENPVPAALMGAGLAWLLFEDKAERAYRRRRIESHVHGYTGDRYTDPHTHSGSYVDARTGRPYDESYGAGYADMDYDGEPDVCPPSMKDKVAGAASSVKETLGTAAQAVSSAASAVGSAASRAGHAVKSAAGTTREAAATAGQSMRTAGHRVGEYRQSAGTSVRRAGESLRDYRERTADELRRFGHLAADRSRHGYEVSCERFNAALDEKPLAVGVAALAAGLLAGFALPRTRLEDRSLGRTSDRLKDEAKRRGQEAVEQGREIASHVASEALGEAESQGLTPGGIGEKVARVAKDAFAAAQQAAQREGIDPGSLAERAQIVGQAVKEKGREELKSLQPSEDSRALGTEEVMGLTDTGTDAGLACGVGSTASSKAGGMSDFGSSGGEMSSVKHEAEIKHDIAEGMSSASEGKTKGKTKKQTGASGDSCSC